MSVSSNPPTPPIGRGGRWRVSPPDGGGEGRGREGDIGGRKGGEGDHSIRNHSGGGMEED